MSKAGALSIGPFELSRWRGGADGYGSSKKFGLMCGNGGMGEGSRLLVFSGTGVVPDVKDGVVVIETGR